MRLVRTPSSQFLLFVGLLVLPAATFAQQSGEDSDSKPTLGILFAENIMFTNKAFCASVRFAGLVDTLKSDAPFTVFVYTNEAAGELEDEFPKPQNDPAFRSLVEYHVVPGRKIMASDFLEVETLPTLEGSTISVETKGGTTVVAEGGEEGQNVSKQPETIVLRGQNTVTIGPDPTHRNITTTTNGVIHIVESELRVPDQ